MRLRDGELGEMGHETPAVEEAPGMPLMALNHVSFVVRSVNRSVRFYEEVLGFTSVKRPSSFRFDGAWLFNYGLGIHLLECGSRPERKRAIDPKDNHISFQCSDMGVVVRKLETMGVAYVTAVVEEGGLTVDQLFFHDPDGYMIEICNCHVLPVLPLSPSCSRLRKRPLPAGAAGVPVDAMLPSPRCSGEAEKKMMEILIKDIMDISL